MCHFSQGPTKPILLQDDLIQEHPTGRFKFSRENKFWVLRSQDLELSQPWEKLCKFEQELVDSQLESFTASSLYKEGERQFINGNVIVLMRVRRSVEDEGDLINHLCLITYALIN